HSIHFQWIPWHVGIEANERADFLDRTAAVEGVRTRGNLTFYEISTISKLELNRQIKTPPSHAWYFAKCPGESFRLSSRPLQSTYSRFLSGHTRALRFSNGQKTFPECHWCSSGEASPNHILFVWVLKRTSGAILDSATNEIALTLWELAVSTNPQLLKNEAYVKEELLED
ncbi:RNase H domain-containing protein, partial [Trichonephila clavipes]